VAAAGITGSVSGSSAPAPPRVNAARLTVQQRATIAKLSATDRDVRAHEMAHLTVAGPYAIGGPSYTFTVGPDGQMYATGGDVQLDAAPDPSDPKKTIEKAKVIEAAAYAPADPSNQDRRVAAQAAGMEQAAERQLEQQQQCGQGDASSGYGTQSDVATGQIISEIL
jgi:hypothetical protein